LLQRGILEEMFKIDDWVSCDGSLKMFIARGLWALSVCLILALRCQEVFASSMTLTTSSFKSNAPIPTEFVRYSPALEWGGAPAGTKSFAIICHDPDAPNGDFIHWLAYDIPAARLILPVDAGNPGQQEFRQGINGFDRLGWSGPMPPPGKVHRYYITVYALNAILGDLHRPKVDGLKRALNGHVLGQSTVMGTFSR
jgi:Raf kinase inhibitor-like YbhB/YbcL family protein